jgi:hypothetical protein
MRVAQRRVAPTSARVKRMMTRVATRMREIVIVFSRDLQKYRCHADFFDVEDRAARIGALKKIKNFVRARVSHEPILRACTAQKYFCTDTLESRFERLSRASLERKTRESLKLIRIRDASRASRRGVEETLKRR